jgi:RHS repeat-associated protein
MQYKKFILRKIVNWLHCAIHQQIITSANYYIISLCFCASVVNSYAATESIQSSLSGNTIIPNATINLEDQWFSYMQDNPNSWQDEFGMKEVSTFVILRFDDTKKEYFSSDWIFDVTYDIILTYSDFTTDTIYNESLSLSYYPTERYADIAMNKYVGAHRAELQVTSVNGNTLPDISLDIQMNVERYYQYENNITYNISGELLANNQFQITWDYVKGAEYYELEYLFVDMLEDPSETHAAFDFKNATRITTANTYYVLSLAYPKGALIYRVRGIGFLGDQFNYQNISEWSYDPWYANLYGNGFTDEVPLNYIYEYNGLSDSLNWQYTVSYAEGGKRKEILSFADGSLRNRLSVSIANTDSNAIVNVPVYDHQGRVAVQVLPAPVISKGLQYYQADENTDMNGNFNRTNFDTDSKISNPDSLPELSAANIYYSNTNPDQSGSMAFIPDAEGYAYSQSIFKNDGTNRISKQAGLGAEFKSGSGHEVKYYYGAPSGQIELDRLFGSEVGNVEHYKKNMVQDANGQISISYIDEHGRTIATALAGQSPANLIEIDHKPDADTLTANLLDPNKKIGDNEMRSTKVISVSAPSDFHFLYDFNDTIFCDADTCLPCQTCIYDLLIIIKDADENILYNSTIENNNEIIRIDATTNNHYEFILPSSVMQIGTYTITKSLKLNAENLSGIDSLFSSDQLCVPYDSIEPEPCNINCQSLCAEQYTRLDANGNTYYVDENENIFYNLSDVQHLIDSCISNTCEKHFESGLDLCVLKKGVMMADVSPGGQYFDNTPDQYILENDIWYINPLYDPNEWLNKQSIPSIINLQYSNWDDVRSNWEDSWAEEMFELHPEICNYEYFCEYQPSLSGIANPAFTDYREYDKIAAGINDDSSAHLSPFYFFNPLAVPGTFNSSGPANDNSSYINSTGPASAYQDPFFVNNSGARDSMEKYLTHFIELAPYTGDYYSIWYVLEDPDDIANNNYTNVDASVQAFFSSLHNDLFAKQSISKFQFYKSVYAYFKQSIIAQQYPQWHDQYCDYLNDYYLTEVGNGLDSNGFQIRWIKNEILDFNLITVEDLATIALDQFNTQCTQSCELHADDWMLQIEGCYSKSDSVNIRNLLIDVCAAACDMAKTPYGSSAIADPSDYITVIINGSNHTFSSFEDVLSYYGISCPLIEYPEEYDEAKCSCESYQSYLSNENLSGSDYSGIVASLYNLTGLSYSTSEVSTWNVACAYSPSLNDLDNLNFPEIFWCTESTNPEDNIDSLMAAVQEHCEEQALLASIYESDKQYQQNVKDKKQEYLENYANSCFADIENRENFEVTYVLDEYLYTLYYYDQANNIIKTIPPQGIKLIDSGDTLEMIDEYRKNDSIKRILPSHEMITQYAYNSLNQLRWQRTPDGGTTHCWYDEIGRICLSQNEKQKNENAYAYTIYDALSRVIENGQIKNIPEWDTTISFINQVDFSQWLTITSVTKDEISKTDYDKQLLALSDFTPENLRGRVSAISYDEDGDGSHEFATYFSYDQHGNVKSLIQQNVRLADIETSQQYKRIDYEYDLISGNIKAVHYQNGELDQFHHYYQYDADSRLTHIFTSDNEAFSKTTLSNTISNFKFGTLNSKLFYYPHGPLMRTELGDKQVQGIDYAYTLQGWLKAVNSSTLQSDRDMGKDGNPQLTIHNYFSEDALSFSLQYYDTDYRSISYNSQITADTYPLATHNSQLTTSLYNGNISQMVLHYLDNNESAVQVHAESYTYDQLNRIKNSDIYIASDIWGNDDISNNNTLANAVDQNEYKTAYQYDFNGNIESLNRNGYSASGLEMDDLQYHYKSGNNQLNYVEENTNASYSSNYSNDINAGQSNSNYEYDEIGNLIHDEQEEIDTIIWNLQGKIKEIRRKDGSTKSDLIFYYDGMGNRIGKLAIPRNSNGEIISQENWLFKWYTLDISGNIMAVYGQSYVVGLGPDVGIENKEMLLEQFTIEERMIYGNKRLGVNYNDHVLSVNAYTDYSFNSDGTLNLQYAAIVDPNLLTMFNSELDTIHFGRVLGHINFELTDHLGNVRSVISDRKLGVSELMISEENFNTGTENWLPYSTNTNYIITTGDQNGKLFVSTKGNMYGVSKNYTLAVNHTYEVSFDFELTKGKKVRALASNKSGSNILGSSQELTTDGHYSYTFTTTTDTTIIYFLNLSLNGTNCEFYIDNFKIMQTDTLGYYVPDVISAVDYYPFGSLKPNRCFSSPDYKYGYNGMEKDDEVKGDGNSYDFGARIYDPRIAKFLSIDPQWKKFPDWSPYTYALDNPIYFVDPDGEEPTPAALKKAAESLGIPVASIRAVYFVETGGNAFRDNGDPKILFERHYFNRLTGGKYDATYPSISNSSAGGYGKYNEQIGRLKIAATLNSDAAYKSASYGGFQIMGTNYKSAGFNSVTDFANAMMSKDEDKHLGAFVNFVNSNPKMLKALQDQDWAGFAKLYNGPDYAKNKYDTKMADAFSKYSGESLGEESLLSSIWNWSVTNLWDSWSVGDLWNSSSNSYTIISQGNLNMRAGAGSNNKVIGSLSSGSIVTGTGNTDGNWTEVTSAGKTGWVSSKYVKGN